MRQNTLSPEQARKISDEVKKCFRKYGMTNDVICHALGLRPTSLSGSFSRGCKFGANRAAKYAQAFGFSYRYLITGEGELIEKPWVLELYRPPKEKRPLKKRKVALPKEKRSEINRVVKAYFRSFGITHEEIARRVGSSVGAVDAAMNGSTVWGPKKARAYAIEFGLNEDYLMHGKGELFTKKPKGMTGQREMNYLRTILRVQKDIINTQQKRISKLEALLRENRITPPDDPE